MKAKLLRVVGLLLVTSPLTVMLAWGAYDLGWKFLIPVGFMVAGFGVLAAGAFLLYQADQLERR